MNKDIRTPLQTAIDILGPYKVAKLVGRRGPSIYKWRQSGRLPRTDWTGETNYAETIARALQEAKVAPAITRDQLLNGWQAGEFRSNADAQPAETVQT